ncbi:MAG: glycerophosphodiester phosphodiesterase family protein, partial [Candidatus Cryptobacteroides sp.]
FPRCKGSNYEYSHHLPLALMWGDGVRSPGRVEDGFVSFVDFAPTILDLAGIEPEDCGMDAMAGRSIKANITDAAPTGRDVLLFGRERDDNGRPDNQGYPIRGIRRGDWLYLLNLKPGLMAGGDPLTGFRDVDSSPTKTAILELCRNGRDSSYFNMSLGRHPGRELYNVKEDPYCVSDRAGDAVTEDIANELDSLLRNILSEQGDPRMGSDGDVFDRYPFDDPAKAGAWERVAEGLDPQPWLKTSWVVPSDYAQFEGFAEPFTLEAHRGLSNRYPENTELAFIMAGRSGAFTAMETDVQMTSDGVLVCMHDKTIDRTTDGTGRVVDYTFEELCRFRIDGGFGWDDGYSGQLTVPTFERYLEICREYSLTPYVELKLLSPEGILKTIRTLEENGFKSGYVLTSGRYDYLETASLYSDMPLEYMKKEFTKADIDSCKGLRNIVIRPSATFLTESIAKYCIKKGLRLECYGIPVGDKVLLSRLRAWGVSGGTCNDHIGL